MLFSVALFSTLCAISSATESVKPPANLVGMAWTSPEINSDRQVTFRYSAPNAKQVTLQGELDGQSHPMTRDSLGLWSVTLSTLSPDIYTYTFQVDGIVALDAKNPNTKYGYGMFGAVSVFEISGDSLQFYDSKPVPHGMVRILPYHSKAMGLERTAWVYTPPGYEQAKNLPVLYLLHGAGDVESGWTMVGRANLILDNLIAEGKAKPMVVVMPLGHAAQSWWTGPTQVLVEPITQAFQSGIRANIGPAMYSGDGKGGLSLFARDLIDDVMPRVEKEFKVAKSPENRAIAGLSMGGGQSIHVAFSRPGLFRYVVLMSPAADGRVDQVYPDFFGNAAGTNKKIKLLWLGATKDDKITGAGDAAFDSLLTSRGIKHTYVLGEGRHEWTVWRHNLRDIAQLLFR
jgi:enterochelin esterase-like enzyme